MVQRCKAFKWHLGTRPLISMALQTVSLALGIEKCHSNSAAELLLCCAHANVQCCHAAVNRYHSICSMLHVEMHSRIWSQQAFGRNQPPLRRLQWTAFEIPRPEMQNYHTSRNIQTIGILQTAVLQVTGRCAERKRISRIAVVSFRSNNDIAFKTQRVYCLMTYDPSYYGIDVKH